MGVFFALFFLLVKEICMLFTHISISTQTHRHTQIHMHTQRAVVWKRVWRERGDFTVRDPLEFSIYQN